MTENTVDSTVKILLWYFTSFKTAGVRTSPATSRAVEKRTSKGKFSSTHSLCFCVVESSGVHNLSPRASWVKLISPAAHPPQTMSEIKIEIQGFPPTAFPNLEKNNRSLQC